MDEGEKLSIEDEKGRIGQHDRVYII